MHRRTVLGLGVGLAATAARGFSRPASAQAPPFETRKITENVYVFRYQFHQAMFVVTPDGVIATDPIGYLRPQAVTTYVDEIRKITPAPVRYVVYSHHHYDHIDGGKPFKDLGARFVAHKNAKAHLEALSRPSAVIPDDVVDDFRTLEVGGVRLELAYVGRNHSDNSLVMRVPKDRLIFTVDFIPIETVQFRNMLDGYLPDWFNSLDRVLAMEWDRMIPGFTPTPGAGWGPRTTSATSSST